MDETEKPTTEVSNEDMTPAVESTPAETVEDAPQEVEETFVAAVKSGVLVPILCGSATLNLGVPHLLNQLVQAMPSPLERPPEDPYMTRFFTIVIIRNRADCNSSAIRR